MRNISSPLKTSIFISYVAVIVVNYLAVALPINGKNTGELSDAYPNLFTPAGITFSIWGLIYLLLLLYVLFSLGWLPIKPTKAKTSLYNRTGWLFVASSCLNIAWIFAWHYELIPLSVIIMVALLISLIMIADTVNKHDLTSSEKPFLCLPFSVYFGWITVATIANITVFFVSIGWDGWGISDHIWTILVLIAGLVIGALRAIKDKKPPYLLVLIWAYIGIWIKHASASGFNGAYPSIIWTTIVCIALFAITFVWVVANIKEKA
jgi:hypothetical protein